MNTYGLNKNLDLSSLNITKESVGAGFANYGSETIIAENWWTTPPYGFMFFPNSSESVESCLLPLNPANIVIDTIFATNIIPTIYGTVEEHSEIRYHDISIDGTTGFIAKYVGKQKVNEVQILSSINNSNGDPDNQINTNQIRDSITSDNKKTGYYAFHLFRNFLTSYKDKVIASSKNKYDPGTSPLYFLNYKDNKKYNAVIQRFTMRKSADNPMLYNYTIRMRCYNELSLNVSQGDGGTFKDYLKNKIITEEGGASKNTEKGGLSGFMAGAVATIAAIKNKFF